MKDRQLDKPQPKFYIGNGKWNVNMDAHQVEVDAETGMEGQTETTTFWEYEHVEVQGKPTYPKVVDALVRERYTISDELAIHRQREIKYDQFVEYNQFVEHCKAIARSVFYPEQGGE